jgi:phosphatidylglycerol lysyltransferase
MHRRLPLGWTALVSFVSHAVSHNAGFAVLTGGSVRMRMYSAFGLGMAEVAGVIAFAGLTFALGTAALGAGAFMTESAKIAPLLHLPAGVVSAAGWVIAALLAGYLLWTATARRPMAVGMWRVAAPGLSLSLAQVVVAAADLAFVAAALYVLLPLGGVVSYPAFLGLYVVATLVGILSHVPGGLGVFEGTLLLLLPEAPAASVLGAMLVFRLFYNLAPLVLAAVILAVFELVARRRHASPPKWAETLGPPLGGVLAFGAGAVLLLSGATELAPGMPAWLAEPAHLLGGAAGAVLLAAGWGLVRQERGAYRIALGALGAGAVLALLRGPDWGASAAMVAVAALLAAAEPLFREQGPAEAPPAGWAGAAASVVAVSFWLTLHGQHLGLAAAAQLFSFAPGTEAGRALRGETLSLLALTTAALTPLWPRGHG